MLINERIGMLVQRGSQLYLFREVIKFRALPLMDHARAKIGDGEIDFFQIASIGGPKDRRKNQNRGCQEDERGLIQPKLDLSGATFRDSRDSPRRFDGFSSIPLVHAVSFHFSRSRNAGISSNFDINMPIPIARAIYVQKRRE